MKKNMITIAVIGTLLALTGCGADNSSSTPLVPSGAETTTSGPASTGDTQTTSAAAPEETQDSEDFGEAIFGGYVTADTDLKKNGNPNSETLLTIPDGTQIGVYDSPYAGWFRTEFNGKTGYIPADAVKEIPPFDPALGGDNVKSGFVSENVKLMSGIHSYAEVLAEIPKGTQLMYYLLASDESWSVVNYQEKIGYVETQYINLIGDSDQPLFHLELKDLTGGWYYQEYSGSAYESKAYVSVETDGTYSYQPLDGSAGSQGIVRVETVGEINEPVYVFHETKNPDSKTKFTFHFGQYSPDEYYESDGAMLAGIEADKTHELEYIGLWKSTEQWNGSDFTIQISQEGGSLKAVVSSHSAVADYQWDYTCRCSSDNTFISCNAGGTLKRTDYAPDGTAQAPVTVYTDGTARFSFKGGTLFWSEEKEDTARQVGFSRAQ